MSVSYDANVIKLGKLWKGLGKLADKVVVTGEITELDGNFAINSIEQIGTVERVKNDLVVSGSNLNDALTIKSKARVGDKLEFSLKQPYIATAADTKIVVHGKYTSDISILNKVTNPSQAQSNLLKLLPDGGFVIDKTIGGSYAYVVYNKEIYQYQTSGTHSLIFVLTQPIEQFTISTNMWDYAFNYINLTGDRILFHSFFTEQQYQALLNLIK